MKSIDKRIAAARSRRQFDAAKKIAAAERRKKTADVTIAERQRAAEKRAREKRKAMPDEESTEEVERRAKLAKEIKDGNLLRKQIEGRESQHSPVREKRYKAHTAVPDSRGRFG